MNKNIDVIEKIKDIIGEYIVDKEIVGDIISDIADLIENEL